MQPSNTICAMKTRVMITGSILVGLAALIAATPIASAQIPVMIFAYDGTPLATDIYRPLGGGPHPVILIRTPYGRDGMVEPCLAFALLGYACVAQDTRGRGESGGVDTVFRDDADDGRATVEWLSEQSWCDGNIGMFGGSAFAITQYLPAPGADSALRSIAPTVATPDLYHHAFLQGGAIREALAVGWLEDQGAEDFFDQVLDHRLKDAWWDPVEVLEHAGSTHTEGLHVGGWYDIFGQGTLDAFTAIQRDGGSGAAGRQYLVMGPWTHGGLFTNTNGALTYPFNAVRDPLDLYLPWYDATLRGDRSEIDHWPAARIYLMGAVGEPGAPGNEWIEFDTWPPPAVSRHFHLSAEGGLAMKPPAQGELTLVSDPINPVPTLGGANLQPHLVVDGRAMGDGPQDQREIEARSDVLSFTTEPLVQPLPVVGPVRAKIWLVPDTTDLDLAVRLSDVYPDGRSMLVLDGIQRARMRCGDDHECLLTPGVPVELTVELWSTALVFNAGHRIRISVSGSNSPRFEVNPNNGADLGIGSTPVVARPRLLFGIEHPSRLKLPVLPMTRHAGGRMRPIGEGVRIPPSVKADVSRARTRGSDVIRRALLDALRRPHGMSASPRWGAPLDRPVD
jgi:predicted acyl esterase